MITDEQAQREMAWAIERAVFEAVEMEREKAITIIEQTDGIDHTTVIHLIMLIRSQSFMSDIEFRPGILAAIREKVHRRFGSQAPPSYPREKTSGADASEASTARSERSEPGASSPARRAGIEWPAPLTIPRSEIFCEHANESPAVCPCRLDCICRERPHCAPTGGLTRGDNLLQATCAHLDARLDRLVEVVEMLIKQDRMRYTLEHLSEKLKAV